MGFVRVERATRASRLFAALGVLVCFALASLPLWRGRGEMRLVGEIAYYIALAQLWNLLAGYAGLVSIGQQAYVGIGAYALFYLAEQAELNVYVALALAGPIAGLISAMVSFAIFRLRGAYSAIGTWVVAEVFSMLAGLSPELGSGSGLSLTPAVMRQISANRGVRDTLIYLIAVGFSLLMCFVVYGLLRSRHGLALTAIRDSERASASLGVDTARTKRVIYVFAATSTGWIGALIFLQKLHVSPEAGFSVNDWTAAVIFIVVIGGIGTLEGPIVGAVIYFLMRELLVDYGAIYLILLGLLAIAVMLKTPSGLWGWVQHRFDLQLLPVGRRLVLEPARERQDDKARARAPTS